MIRNVGTLDRFLRVVVAITIAVLIFTGVIKGVGIVIFAVFGFYILFTAIFGFCPLYTLVGLHTLRTRSGPDD